MGNTIDPKPSLVPNLHAVAETTKKAAGKTATALNRMIYQIYNFVIHSMVTLAKYLYNGFQIAKEWTLIGYAFVKEWSVFLAKKGVRYSSQFLKAAMQFTSVGLIHLKTFASVYRSQLLLAGGSALTGAALYALVDTVLRENKPKN